VTARWLCVPNTTGATISGVEELIGFEVAAFIQSGKNRADGIRPAISYCSRKRTFGGSEAVMACVTARGKATA